MSYKKAMKHSRNVRKMKAQRRMHFGFSTLGPNERRKVPWFGSWTLTATDEEVQKAIQQYELETQRILKENPSIKLV